MGSIPIPPMIKKVAICISENWWAGGLMCGLLSANIANLLGVMHLNYGIGGIIMNCMPILWALVQVGGGCEGRTA